jgi:hypothetical protein
MYKIDMTMKIQFAVYHNAKIFNTVRTQDYFITNIVVKMDTVGVMRKRYTILVFWMLSPMWFSAHQYCTE